jgi:hypothetical protein
MTAISVENLKIKAKNVVVFALFFIKKLKMFLKFYVSQNILRKSKIQLKKKTTPYLQ